MKYMFLMFIYIYIYMYICLVNFFVDFRAGGLSPSDKAVFFVLLDLERNASHC